MVVAPPASLQEEEKGTWPGCPCPLSPCRAVARLWLRAGSPLAPSISTRLVSGRRGKGHKTFIALENRQGNVCLG